MSVDIYVYAMNGAEAIDVQVVPERDLTKELLYELICACMWRCDRVEVKKSISTVFGESMMETVRCFNMKHFKLSLAN